VGLNDFNQTLKNLLPSGSVDDASVTGDFLCAAMPHVVGMFVVWLIEARAFAQLASPS